MKDININPGDVFGRLTVIERAEDYVSPDGKHKSRWLCECSCDAHNRIIAIGTSLKSGNVQSCGCLLRESGHRRGLANIKFGISSTKVAQAYYNMQNKCNNPSYNGYINNGTEVPIAICPRWSGEGGIKRFYDDMSPSYKEGTVLTRIDRSKDYSPENCAWVPGNTRNANSSRSRFIEIEGEKYTMSQWTTILGYSKNRISDRLRMGWNPQEAVMGKPGDGTLRNAIYFVDEYNHPVPQDDPRYCGENNGV